MKTSAKCFLFVCVVFFVVMVYAQETTAQPEIGKPMPAFELTNLGNYGKAKMTSEDFKGRFVIIDFWNKGCVSCIQSFPKLNKLHTLYKDKGLDLILVGTDEDGIAAMFDKFKQKQDLKFAYAYNMPLYKNSVPAGAPHILWIDDQGVVQAVSGGEDLTVNNVEAFLSHKPFKFRDRSHAAEANEALSKYDIQTPFLVKANGGAEYESKFKYRSLITEYIPGAPKKWWSMPFINQYGVPPGVPDKENNNRALIEVCTSLEELYLTAYTGMYQWFYTDKSVYNEYQPKIIYELRDSSLFRATREKEIGLYWYSLVIPKEKNNAAYVMESLQNDLYRYFGYHARLETRTFPILKVVATDKAKKLITKGGKTDAKSDHSMYKATNFPLDLFFASAFSYHNYWESGGKVPVIINETGITQNVDLDVKIVLSDWKDVQRVLKELGFELVPGEKEFKVLVISDPK
jgi:thiol-disulfide isomerase/thioredoxin